MNKYADLKPNEIAWQIFIGSDGHPHVFKLSVVSSDADRLVVIPLGDAGDVSGKIVTYEDKDGIPRTYRTAEINRMFSEYLCNIRGWNRAGMFATTPKDLENEIESLAKTLELWKQTRMRGGAIRLKASDEPDSSDEGTPPSSQ